MESETCKVCSHCLQKAPSHHLLFLTPHHHIVTVMSTNVSSISTVSSLPILSLLSSGSSSPTSIQSDAGWGLSQSDGRGSPDVHCMPTPPPAQMEPTLHSSVTLPPILSVDVPLNAHRLHEGSLKEHRCDSLHSLLYTPHLHRTFEFHLEPNSPLWSIIQIYLQNQHLKSILNLTSSPSSIGCRCNTLHTIQCEIEEDLFSTFYQLQMPEFADDVERYIKEMTTSTNPQPLPFASSSPLSPEVELTLQCTELHHEVNTTGTIHGIPIDAPLSHNHPTTTSCVLNVTTLDTFVSTVSGTFSQFVKSIALATLNIVVPWAVLAPVPPLPRLHCPPNLVLFPLLILTGWFPKTLLSGDTTLALDLPLVLVPP